MVWNFFISIYIKHESLKKYMKSVNILELIINNFRSQWTIENPGFPSVKAEVPTFLLVMSNEHAKN